ncbi:hypothetical protein HDV03_002608 [Kappamyces sp. JEL0829]|nr:hypothetical protein HDV03_002608 [Kappamyces sp. JEL0829]
MNTLPVEVLLLVAETNNLTGWDLITLSKTNRAWRTILTQSSHLWAARLGNEGQTLEDYEAKLSLLFSTRKLPSNSLSSRGGASQVFLHDVLRSECMSLELWFSPARNENLLDGGILLGGQSGHVLWDSWPHFHQQLAIVDTQGNFYCSFLDRPKERLGQVDFERWNHLVVTLDRPVSTEPQTERVYLNGKHVATVSGFINREWNELIHLQVGTGVISANAVGAPSKEYCDWWDCAVANSRYGFNGAVDRTTLYREVLSHDQIVGLYRGTLVLDTGSNFTGPYVNVRHIQCKRPYERLFKQYSLKE